MRQALILHGIYVRPTTDDDDDWGDELIKGSIYPERR